MYQTVYNFWDILVEKKIGGSTYPHWRHWNSDES